MESGQRIKDGQPLPPLQHVLGITSRVHEEAGAKQMQDSMGRCGACWAFVVVECLQDRLCIPRGMDR